MNGNAKMHHMSTPGETIKRWMDAKSWSEGQLERRSGVKQPTIHRIITGESKEPRRTNLEKIARAFGRSVDDLYDTKSKPGKPTADDQAFDYVELTHGLTDSQLDLLMRLAEELRQKP